MNSFDETNKLIIEFLGYEFYKGYYIHPDSEKPSEMLWLPDLHYHDDWEWLMNVVGKIEYEHGFLIRIEGFVCEITSSSNENPRKKPFQIKKHSSTKMLATYEAVVEFIKWYNKENIKEV
jgi:adenosine deaminase